jgi:hydroxyacylglutathione hydrolase
VRVIETPGHTAGHVSYVFEKSGVAFTADTLFALGCGRLFERPAKDMWTSLSKLLKLPDDTEVYFGHEYTLSNAKFAVTVDPGSALAERVKQIEATLNAGRHTAPTTIGTERRTSPFLRPDDAAIRKHLGMEQAEDWEVFAEIRARKDKF